MRQKITKEVFFRNPDKESSEKAAAFSDVFVADPTSKKRTPFSVLKRVGINKK